MLTWQYTMKVVYNTSLGDNMVLLIWKKWRDGMVVFTKKLQGEVKCELILMI
jgi:isocitrate dehydrogenase